MGKKRSREAQAEEAQDHAADKMDEDGSSDEDDDMDIVNVDFELFNYDADIDFLGVKTLLRQLFDADAALLDLSALSDLVVRQNTIGSTCKVDDKETDPYALLTVLNVGEHRDATPAVARLAEYLTAKARSSSTSSSSSSAAAATVAIADALEKAAARKNGESRPVVGLVLADRLINMPAEIVPPMWTMMLDEIDDAVEDGEPYEFTHYLVVSRAYREVASALDRPEDRPRKQRRKKTKNVKEGGNGDAVGGGEEEEEEEEREGKGKDDENDNNDEITTALQYFHPEDEEMRKYATAAAAYRFTKEGESAADSKRAFQEMGIRPVGFMMLIEAGSRFKDAIKAIGEYVGGPAP